MRSLILIILVLTFSCAEEKTSIKKEKIETNQKSHADGNLFIIGGGSRPPSLIQKILASADIRTDDEIIIIPMASIEPDTACYYSSLQFKEITKAKCRCLYLDSLKTDSTQINKLKNAPLIYLSGGDQIRLMKYLSVPEVKNAIEEAWYSGSTIAGTSAGAAVMSEIMITGDQHFQEEYNPTFDKIWKDNLITERGLGFIQSAIIDQHFIIRSRYNRLLSSLVEFPNQIGIGIDESTAILVHGDSAKVIGSGQVITFSLKGELDKNSNPISMKDIRLNVLKEGDSFSIKKN